MRKRLILTSVISIILIIILMIGSTYSIFVTKDIDENLNVYKTGNLDITYTLSDEEVVLTSNVPVSDVAAVFMEPYHITVNNVGNVPYKFNVVLDDTTATNAINYKYIETKVGGLDSKLLTDCTNNIIKEGVIVPANDSVDIDIRIYLSEDIQNSEIGKGFFAKLSIDGLAIYDDNEDIDNSILSLPKGKILVNFDAGDGELTDVLSKEVEYGEVYGELPIPTRTGYAFDGWYTSFNDGEKITSDSVVDILDNHTLYAKWTASSNVVTFDGNGGTPSISSKGVIYGESYGVLPSAVRDGYELEGWYTEASGGTQVTSSIVVSTTEDHTLYAHWTEGGYEVIFVVNGGTAWNSSTCTGTDVTFTSSTCSKIVTYNSTYGDLPTPTRIGYTFAGWYTEVTDGTQVTDSSTVSIADDQTLYARWTANSYTITISAGNGIESVLFNGWVNSGTSAMTNSLEYGEVIDLSAVTVGYKTGYSGGPSCELVSGSGTLNGCSFTVGASDTTISLNATTLAAPAPSIVTSSSTKVYGSGDVTLTATQITSYDSGVSVYYSFGTSTSSTGTYTYGSSLTTNTFVIPNDSSDVTDSVSGTYFGRRYYKVRAYATDGILTSSTATYDSYRYVTLQGAIITLNPGGCGTISSGTNPFYAKYGTSETYTSSYGTTLATAPSFTVNAGYDFNGWYSSSSGGNKVLTASGVLTGTGISNYSNSSGQWVATSSQSLYAQCTRKTYTVTYNCNGGSGCPASQTKTYGVDLTLSSTIPTKTGYTFLGWSNVSSSATSATHEAGGTYTGNEAETFYAVWGYRVTFDVGSNLTTNLSSGVTYKECGVGSGTTCTITLPTLTPTDGYYTYGWNSFILSPGESGINGGTSYTASNNNTLYARAYYKNYEVIDSSTSVHKRYVYSLSYSNLTDGETLKVLTDVTDNGELIISANEAVTIDMNGKAIEFEKNTASIVNAGTLTITSTKVSNCYIMSTLSHVISNSGTLNLNGCIYESTGSYVISNSGTLNIGTGESGAGEGDSNTSIASKSSYGIYNTSSGIVNYYVGANTYSGSDYAVYNAGTFNLYGGYLYYNTSAFTGAGTRTLDGSWTYLEERSAFYFYVDTSIIYPTTYSYRQS